MSGKEVAVRPFTGRDMLVIMVSFFSVIVGVNLLMAYYANSTWSGLVVKNSYVASQQFNKTVDEVKQQDALGWVDRLSASEGTILFSLRDAGGRPVSIESARLILRRPVTDRADVSVELAPGADFAWTANLPLSDGVWIAEIDVIHSGGEVWRDTKRFAVKEGEIR